MLEELKMILEFLAFLFSTGVLFQVYDVYDKAKAGLKRGVVRYSQHIVVAFILLSFVTLLEFVDSFTSGPLKDTISLFQGVLWVLFFAFLASGLQYLYIRRDLIDIS